MDSASASRWPSERSRGWMVSSMPGASRSSSAATGPGLRVGAGVGGGALLGDGLEVEQVGGRLRHQAHVRTPLGGRQVGRVVADHGDGAGAPLARALQGPDQARLAGAVASHQHGDATGGQGEVDLADGDVGAVDDGDGTRREQRLRPRHGRRRRGRRQLGQRPGVAAGVADGQRERVPAHETAELDQRRGDGRVLQQPLRLVDADAAVAGDQADPVGEGHDPLEAVLREQDGQAEVVDEPGDGREHVLGGGRVERRGGLVQHQHARVRGEHGADRDALLLAAGEGAQVARPEVRDAEQVEGLLDAAAHRAGRCPELLHAVGELLLDRVGDEARPAGPGRRSRRGGRARAAAARRCWSRPAGRHR